MTGVSFSIWFKNKVLIYTKQNNFKPSFLFISKLSLLNSACVSQCTGVQVTLFQTSPSGKFPKINRVRLEYNKYNFDYSIMMFVYLI